jgi:hypothetical protein
MDLEENDCAMDINKEWRKSVSLGKISIELAKLGQIDRAIKITKKITSNELNCKSESFFEITKYLIKDFKIQESLDIISNYWDKNK